MLLLAQTALEAEEPGLAWYAYPFYLWLFVSLGYWVWRFATKSAREKREATDEEGSATDAGLDLIGTERPRRRRAKDEPTVDEAGSDPFAGRMSPTEQLFHDELAQREAERASHGSEALGADVGVPPPASDPDTGAARSGFFAPTPREAPSGSRRPVADLVQGIELPAGLSPVITSPDKVDRFRVLFVTTTAEPAEVGSGVGDELERLGFALRSTSPTELEATRAGAVLYVTLHPDAQAAQGREGRLFPHAAAGAVGVILES